MQPRRTEGTGRSAADFFTVHPRSDILLEKGCDLLSPSHLLPRWLAGHFPGKYGKGEENGGFVSNLPPWVYSAAVLAAAVIAGLLLYTIFFRLMSRLARRTSGVLEDSLVRHCAKPARVTVPLLALYISLQFVAISGELDETTGKIIAVLLIVAIAWLFISLTSVLEDIVLSKYNIRDKDNLRARKIYTQFRIVKKILIVTIVLVCVSAILMGFERFRRLGTGILASAGLAGIIAGLAARPALSNLIAGVQIALTEPITLEDVVIVENEWGWIEEITLTYVVVRIWDLRRLIVPIGYFLEKPFQNWTRKTADLIGSVYLYVDYTVPVEEVREELQRILKNSTWWKGTVSALQVVDTTEKTMQLRAIMDAANSSDSWNLRCEVREKLVDFVRRNYPGALPVMRAELLPKSQRAEGPET
jgi:small-conductance mechanosensitive channel